ncbi:MAG: response regulator, partial [Deltaproteobacteria bacterium]|nr:response regulator [Deltaproteobacteria bacterium]
RQPQPPPQPPPQPRNLFNGRRALLIAPERNTRALFAARLTELGLETTQKDSPEGALEVLAEAQAQGSQVDVLFMDHRCGRTAACALAASIRACPDFDPPGLIFLSPLGDIKEFDELTRNGFNGFLTKPAAFRQVEMALLQLFKGGPSPRDEYPAGVERKTLLFTPPPMKKDGSRPQVLVVDDNPVNRKLLNAILGKVGYQVWLAENGKQAVEEVSRQRFDAVLMDVQMPEMDGLEATRKIRDRLGGRPLPIIAMTAKTMDQDRERCLQAGMNEYLPKPVIPEVLLRLLASWITDPEGGRRQGGMGAIITNYNVLPVLDQRHFRQLREYAATQDGDFYPELLAFFQGEVRGFLKTLEELRENGGEDRLAALTRWAGSLASVCSGLGSPRLHRLARELESQLSEDMTLPTTQVLHRITGEGNALLVQLERESAGWETRNG